MRNLSRMIRPLLAISLLGVLPLSHAQMDKSMAAAIDSLWQVEQPAVSVLGASFSDSLSKAGTTFRGEAKKSPAYLVTGKESAWVLFGKKRFNAIATPWGNFPRLRMQDARLLELNLPKRRYRILVGQGEGLFAVGDWQRYGFLHVLDVSAPSAPAYYPLFSDAWLDERVLGRLPDSPVLNYARLVPTSRNEKGGIEAYEVSLYALGRRGPERVFKEGHALTYALKREGATWVINSVDTVPVTTLRDEESRSFVAAPRPGLFVKVSPTAETGDKR